VRRVFADTLYWVAISFREDPWYAPANAARQRLGGVHLVTTADILTEFLAALSGAGAFYRQQAVRMVRRILADETVTVLPHSRETFLDGLDLYELRADKGYSLADCISMNACRAEGITEVLTNDHHFTQEGFVVLIQRAAQRLSMRRVEHPCAAPSPSCCLPPSTAARRCRSSPGRSSLRHVLRCGPISLLPPAAS
jgi:predicted nucleic acid-binding protein